MKYLTLIALFTLGCNSVEPETCEPVVQTDLERWLAFDQMQDDAVKFGVVYVFELGNVPPISHLDYGEFVWHVYSTKPESEYYLISKNDSVKCLNHF